MQKLVSAIEQITDWLGALLGWLCLAMMLITCAVVAMRYLFHSGGIIFFQELTAYLHATIFLLASGWALKRHSHVRVDVFYRRFSPTAKAWVNSLGVLLFLLPVCVYLFFASIDFVALSWSIKEASGDSGGIAYVYLLKTLIPTSAVALGIQGLAELVKNALFLAGVAQLPMQANSTNEL